MFFGNSSLSLLDDYIVGNKVTPLSVLLCEICAAAEERTSERERARTDSSRRKSGMILPLACSLLCSLEPE